MPQLPTVLHKLLTPSLVEDFFYRGSPLIYGPVTAFDDTVAGWSATDLLAAYEIDGDWQVFPPDIEHVHVLRMPRHDLMHLTQPEHFGAPTPWPIYDTGFLNATVPVWDLSPTYVPPGGEIWRVTNSGDQTHLATFTGLGSGWRAAAGSDFPNPAPFLPPMYSVGPLARFDQRSHDAEFTTDGLVTLITPAPDKPGFTEGRGGTWTRTVSIEECESIYALRTDATWNKIPLHFIGTADGKAYVQLSDPQPHLIEPLNATLSDVNVFQIIVRENELTFTDTYRDDLPR